MRRWFVVTSFVILLGVPHAWATVDNLKTYKQAYPKTEPKATSCKTCHENPIGRSTDLNGYGKALKAFKGSSGAKRLTIEDYRAFEAEDTDGDGAKNLDELNGGTDPSDPDSKLVPTSRGAPDPHSLQVYLRGLLMPDASADEHAPDTAAPAEPASAAATASYVGMETCAACHAKEWKEFEYSTHARISIPGETNMQGCESCHGPGSLHVEAGGGRGVGGMINPRKDPNTCFECHTDKKAELHLPYRHPILEGKMSCADCHSPHGEDVRPWSATTMQDVNETCFKCHKEQRGPFVWEHEGLREGCTTCHKVHGSIHEKMLIARDSSLCLRCHTQVNFPTIGKNAHAARLPQSTCFSAGCHTAVHGSNFDDHLRY